MVKMKSKMQSCKEACNWLRSHTWDCEPANGIQAELGLLLRGVACNRVSWVFSLSLTQSVSCSLTLSLLLLALPLPSLTPFPPPPRLPIALSQQFFLHLYMCRRGRSTCWKFYWIFYAACCLLEPSKSYTWSSVCARVRVWQCSLESVKVCMCFSCLFFCVCFPSACICLGCSLGDFPSLFFFPFRSSTASFTKFWYLCCLVVAWWDSMFFCVYYLSVHVVDLSGDLWPSSLVGGGGFECQPSSIGYIPGVT